MVSKADQQLACVAADGWEGEVASSPVGDSAGAMTFVGDDEMAVASMLVEINNGNFPVFFPNPWLSS